MSTKVDTLLIEPGTATTGQVLTYNATTNRWAAQTLPTVAGDDCPIGSILFFAAQTPPTGWLVCDGSNYPTDGIYADLWAVIGNIYGTVGTNFKIPDLRGEFIRGWSSGRTGVDPGRPFGQPQTDEIKAHTHPGSYLKNEGSGVGLQGNPGGTLVNYGGAVQTTGGIETRPRNVALLPCIKAIKTLPGTDKLLNFIIKPANPIDGQVLTYNQSSGSWIGSSSSFILRPTSSTEGQVLTYNGLTQTWVASAAPSFKTTAFTIDGSSLAKAWVNFDGTGSNNTDQTIRSSYNVNRVYKNNTGVYTVVFSTPFENNSYIVNGIGGGNAGVDSHNNSISLHLNNVTTLSCEIFSDSGDGAAQDSQVMCCTFFASGGNLTGTANVFDTTPVGTVTYFAASAAPVGYMICNGTVLSRAAYPELFTVIGTIYNTGGEGVSNFRLPNLLGEFIRGWDNGRGIDVGRVFGQFQPDEFKSHSHDYSIAGGGILAFVSDPGSALDSSTTTQTGTTGGTETRPRNVALLPCIKIVRTVTGDTSIINYIEKPASATNGQVLSYNSTTGRWVATNNTASLPSGTNGQVLTYDGGTSTWVASAAPASSNITAVTLAASMVILQEQQPSGTPAGSSSGGSWIKRNLNTEVSDLGGLCQLSNGQFTLLAGTYAINASAPCYRGDENRIRLFNVTDSTTTCFGTVENATTTSQTRSIITHIFSIPSTKTFEIQHYMRTAESGDGLGVALGQGTEIYTNVEITKSVALSAGNPIIDTVPIGTVSWYSASAVPVGYLECDGSAIEKSRYYDLWTVIGTRYNTGGEGTTKFRLPDLRGEFVRGWSHGKGGVDVGRGFGSTQDFAIQTPITTNNAAWKSFFVSSARSEETPFRDAVNGLSRGDGFIDNGNGSITRANINVAAETRPRNIALLPCIKAERTVIGSSTLNFIDKPSTANNGDTLVYNNGKWQAGKPTPTTPTEGIVAWVNFSGVKDENGRDNVTFTNTKRYIRASNNVESVTKVTTGYYKITFLNPMPDDNYIVQANGAARVSLLGAPGSPAVVVATPIFNSFTTDARIMNSNRFYCHVSFFVGNQGLAAVFGLTDPDHCFVTIIR